MGTTRASATRRSMTAIPTSSPASAARRGLGAPVPNNTHSSATSSTCCQASDMISCSIWIW